MSEWISVEDHLTEVEKTYLVKTSDAETPWYKTSYYGKNHITNDIAFSVFKKNYKKHWAIENSPGEWAHFGGRVTHWAYLPGGDEDNED